MVDMGKKIKLDPDEPLRLIIEDPEGGRALVVGTIISQGAGGMNSLYVKGGASPLPAVDPATGEHTNLYPEH